MQQTLEGVDALVQKDPDRTLATTLEALQIAKEAAEYVKGLSRSAGGGDSDEVADLDEALAEIFKEAASLNDAVARLRALSEGQ
mmetsp:Transcript_21136/g.40394  ORF Transcript_21136/g.40394 Transcript_21136/m.40394 type:complete len:84 (-) Transcript_21136:66-317(-)